MSTDSENAGPPEGESETSATSARTGRGARPSAKNPAKQAAKNEGRTPATAASERKDPAQKPAATAAPEPDGTPKPAEKREESAAPENGGGGGGGRPGRPGGMFFGGSSGGGGRIPWARVGLYGLAGLVGGAAVAAVLLLADGRTSVQHQVEALRARLARVEGTAVGDSGPVAGGRGALSANLEQIGEELVRLDTRIAKLAGEVTRTRAQLAARLESLEAATPAELPRLLEQWSGQVEGLSNRVAQLERDEMTRDVRRAALALSLANLTRAAKTSRPFVHELKAIEVLDPDNELVAALKPYAETGLPSVSNLTGRFDKVADDVVKVWRREHGRGILEWLWDSIVGLFSVRPVGDVEGTNAPALLARAEKRLEEGELHMAVQELGKLIGPEKAPAEEWLEAARARLRLDDLMAEVNRKVLEEIALAEAERKAREESFVPAPRSEESPSPEPGGGATQPQGEADGASER